MDASLDSSAPMRGRKARRPSGRKRPNSAHKTISRGPDREPIDPSTHSILASTQLPSSFHQSNLATGSSSTPLKPNPSTSRISDKKLRAKVSRTDVSSKRARIEREEVNEWLNAPMAGGAGGIEVDEEGGESTWRVGQEEIVKEVGVASGSKRFDLRMDGMGTYRVCYTRNGRNLAIASSLGHVATFDWHTGRLHSEIQLRESVRDIKFLHSEAFYAVAQKKYVFIYDQNGVEVHKLKKHLDVTRMEFLSYHYLLTTVGNAGDLKYHDTSTGVLLTQIPTHLGSPHSMTQNPHSAIIHVGHANGTMTLWSPNLTTPHVKLLAHRGPVTGIAVDPSEGSAGRYCATSGMDGTVKIWDGRMWGREVRSWSTRNPATSLSYSGRGMLAVGGKSGISTYRDLHTSSSSAPIPYLTLPLPSLTASSTAFCPFDDILAVGHSHGISSLLVPGSGEPNFDSAEADIYESYSRRRERDVRGVLEKIRPELITLDPDFLGRVQENTGSTHDERENRSFRQLGRMERLRETGRAEEDLEEGEGEGEKRKVREKRKMKGRGGGVKRYLKKKRQNVIDPALLAMRAKVASQREADDKKRKVGGESGKESGALARFG